MMGVNHEDYDPAAHTVISNASCTTNCLAPMAKALNDEFDDRQGPDDDHPRLHRRTRTSRTTSTRTCAGPARRRSTSCRPRPAPPRRSAWCCPSSRASSTATRCACPIPTGSATDLTFEAGRETIGRGGQRRGGEGRRRPLPALLEDPIVSSDIVTDPASCIFDAPLTKVIGNQVKVVGWYDNEWGYSNRLADLIEYVGKTL